MRNRKEIKDEKKKKWWYKCKIRNKVTERWNEKETTK